MWDLNLISTGYSFEKERQTLEKVFARLISYIGHRAFHDRAHHFYKNHDGETQDSEYISTQFFNYLSTTHPIWPEDQSEVARWDLLRAKSNRQFQLMMTYFNIETICKSSLNPKLKRLQRLKKPIYLFFPQDSSEKDVRHISRDEYLILNWLRMDNTYQQIEFKMKLLGIHSKVFKSALALIKMDSLKSHIESYISYS